MSEQKKRILIFSLAYYPHIGGAEVAVKEITDRLAHRTGTAEGISDIEFHMVTMRFSPAELSQEKIGNVLVHRISCGGSGRIGKLLFQFLASIKASALHKKNYYDATWALMAHSAGVPAALFKLFHTDVPMLLTLQEGDPPKQIERTMLPLWPLFSRAFTHADRVQAISNFLGEWARARNFRGPLSIIPNGVDVEKFKGEKIAHAGTVLITASRLVHKNAVDDVIRALPLVPDVHFKVVGSGPEEPALKKLAEELGVATRVEFLGHVDHEQLPELLHESDIFIRPSRSEGMGNAFIEAMAAGIPVIGTAVGGIPDFLHDGKTGFVVEANSPKSIAEAVHRILENKIETGQVVARARNLVQETYEWDIVAADMRQRVFEPLLVQ